MKRAHWQCRIQMRVFSAAASEWLLPCLILIPLLLVAIGFFVSSQRSVNEVAQWRFTSNVKNARHAMLTRIEDYKQTVLSTAGFFSGSDHVTRSDWKAFMAVNDFRTHVPGFRAIGFSRWITQAEKAAHIQSMRSEGFHDYDIYPPGERAAYSAVVYLEPFDERNKAALGHDPFSNEDRRTAMRKASAEGVLVATGKIVLRQDNGVPRSAFALYYPVRRGDRLLGYIGAVFNTDDLMSQILGPVTNLLRVEVYDGGEAEASAMLYDSDTEMHADRTRHAPRFGNRESLEVAGRIWTMRYSSTAAYEASLGSSRPLIFLFGGVFISLLISLLSWQLLRARNQAAALATANDALKHSIEHREYLVHYDPLTKLPNRTLFKDRLSVALSRAKRQDRLMAVLFVDVDNFKRINDSLGHSAGDTVLQHIAERLKSTMRDSDTTARYAGDEFALLVEDLTDRNGAGALAKRICEALQTPVVIDGQEVVATPSIGISLCPLDGSSPETLIRGADMAMYQAKREGGNSYRFYSEEMNVRASERMSLERRLRRAVENGDLSLHYQPKVSFTTGEILGAEALLRWHDPVEGLIPPAKFIPIAEEAGLIAPIGEWVLRTACMDNKMLQAGGGFDHVIAVNVSGRQFQAGGLKKIIEDTLQASGMAPHCLELEITESTMLSQKDQAATVLRQLNDMGVRLAIDDFGTGYSSLAYLKRFPVHALKIDRSFVMEITSNHEDVAIVNAVIAMARALNLEVVAEGVETAEQFTLLRLLKCDAYQGYYRSKPVPRDLYLNLLLAARASHQRHAA